MTNTDKIELIEKWWDNREDTQVFKISQTTNSIYIRFNNKKVVRISDHPTEKFNSIDLGLDVFYINKTLNKIANSSKRK